VKSPPRIGIAGFVLFASQQEFHVLAKTKLLGPGDSDSVTFSAPAAPGNYTYLCTFPEHYAAGMKGVMTVGR
jgi:azurin